MSDAAPSTPEQKARDRTLTRVVVGVGAVMGGLIAGAFPANPQWLWSMLAGGLGGGIGIACVALWKRPWPAPLRILAIVGVLAVGYFAVYQLLGRAWLLDPRNWEIRSPN